MRRLLLAGAIRHRYPNCLADRAARIKLPCGKRESDMAESVQVVAVVVARAGQADAVVQAIRTIVAATQGEAGCRSYVPHRDVQDPNRFVFIEHWDSQEALDTHNRTPHLQAFAATIEPLLATPLQVLVLQPLG